MYLNLKVMFYQFLHFSRRGLRISSQESGSRPQGREQHYARPFRRKAWCQRRPCKSKIKAAQEDDLHFWVAGVIGLNGSLFWFCWMWFFLRLSSSFLQKQKPAKYFKILVTSLLFCQHTSVPRSEVEKGGKSKQLQEPTTRKRRVFLLIQVCSDYRKGLPFITRFASTLYVPSTWDVYQDEEINVDCKWNIVCELASQTSFIWLFRLLTFLPACGEKKETGTNVGRPQDPLNSNITQQRHFVIVLII